MDHAKLDAACAKMDAAGPEVKYLVRVVVTDSLATAAFPETRTFKTTARSEQEAQDKAMSFYRSRKFKNIHITSVSVL
jgi:hypothetical protein